jgi:apolipoprotein N-acyltransferase
LTPTIPGRGFGAREGFPRAAGIVAGRLALALLPVVIFGVYSRHPRLSVVSFVALVPWVLLYTDDRHPRVSSLYYIVGAWASWQALYYYTFDYGWYAPALMSVVMSALWWPFAPVLRFLHRRWGLPRTLVVPLVWVTLEWLRVELLPGHVALYLLGYSRAPMLPVVQIADLTGVYGVSFLIAAVSGLVGDAAFALRDARGSAGAVLRNRRVLVGAAAVFAAFVGSWTYGYLRIDRMKIEEGPRLAVVQPDVPHGLRTVRSVFLVQALMTLEQIPAGSADMIIWPENAVMTDLRQYGTYLDDLGWLAREKGASLLVGAIDLAEENPGRTHNSAFLVDRDGRIIGDYDKIALLPWSEYVPFDALMQRVAPAVSHRYRSLIRLSWGFLPTGHPGGGVRLLTLSEGSPPFGVTICGENSYPPLPTEAARLGARFLVNITSEGLASAPLQEQMLRICLFRAVENRIAYVRVANNGISCFIDPAGRLESVLVGENGRKIADTGVLIDRVPMSSGAPTVYSRSSDAFAKSCAVVTILLLIRAALRRRRS